MAVEHKTSGWTGWIFFGGTIMILTGIFQALAGLIALFKHSAYLVVENQLIGFNYTQWGWLHLAIGAILILTAFSLFTGSLFGRFMGIVIASLSALANFAFLQSYPLWSLTIIALDVIVIYAIAMHGKELAEY